jgi:hypothetical protein
MTILEVEWTEGNIYEVTLESSYVLGNYVVKGNYLRRSDRITDTLHWPIKAVCKMKFEFKGVM